MKNNKTIIYLQRVVLIAIMTMTTSLLYASDWMPADTVIITDSAKNIMKADSATISQMTMQDTIQMKKRDWSKWRPDVKRAMWLAIVIPGGGQIYNRKYWKLPIVYGGFIGCYYAIRWNNMMYKDYSQAYLDLMDDNPETQSYNQFMHFGAKITDQNKSTYENKFRRRKDYYRRYRDLSSFIMIGVYALSIIDAYVDASLSEFDISDDLSMRVTPTVITGQHTSTNPLKTSALGVHCSLNF